MPQFLITGPPDAAVRFLCAHGAGARHGDAVPEDDGRAAGGAGRRHLSLRVRLHGGAPAGRRRKPPPKAERLMDEYRAAVAAVPAGRAAASSAASRWAGAWRAWWPTSCYAAGRIAGLVCLGYPFHPPKKPEQLRTAHLTQLACPALIVQGERDPFGGRAEVEAYGCRRRSACTGPATATTTWARAAPPASPARAISPPPPTRSPSSRRGAVALGLSVSMTRTGWIRDMVSDPEGLTPLRRHGLRRGAGAAAA